MEDVGSAYAWADFAVTSAGAVTLAELAIVGLPALVVPLARAAFDHQTANARAFAAITGAPWVAEGDFDTERLAALVASVVSPDDAWRAASARMRRAAHIDAAEAVVRACLALVDAKASRI
jgi:UDP-N-acetylglucosamine--N-acetylmuramyl-(pentapeptide) pyrophosphoryl-undecaprenol N-acetylglucosamine transferase